MDILRLVPPRTCELDPCEIEPPDGPRYVQTDPGVGYRFVA